MAISLSNTLEGSSGTAVSTSNTAGPNQFNAVTVTGTGSAFTFDSAQHHGGATAVKSALPAGVASVTFLEWNSTAITSSPTQSFLRFYVYVTAYPSVTNHRLCSLDGNGTIACTVILLNTGVLRVNNTGGGQAAATTAAVPLNQWVRIELDVTGLTGTTGNVEARMYSGANLDGTTADSGGTATATGAALTAALINRARVGPSSSVTNASALTIWYDDVAYSDTSQPGPTVTSTNYTQTPADSLGVSDSLPLLPPDGLAVSTVSDTELDVSWYRVAGATGYDVERDGSVISANQPGSTYSDTGLAGGTTYTYRVRSVRETSG